MWISAPTHLHAPPGDTFRDPNLRIINGYIFGVQWNDVVFCVEALIGGAPWSNGTSLSFRPSALLSTYSIYRYRPLPDAGIVHCPGMANGNCSPLFTGCSMMTSHPHFATATSSRVNTIVHISRAAFASGTITPRSFLMPSGVASASIEGGCLKSLASSLWGLCGISLFICGILYPVGLL